MMLITRFVSLALVIGVCNWLTAADGNDAAKPDVSKGAPTVPVEIVKQNIFVFCPHVEGRGAWSLFVLFDKSNPSKPLSIGLDELPGKNSKELSYKGVLDAQKEPSTRRTELARLDAKDFATGSLEVRENNLLSVKVAEAVNGLKLSVDARIGIDDRFVFGGPGGNHGELLVKYSGVYQCWQTQALRLENTDGRNVVGKYNLTLSGIIFNAGSTRVSRICAVDEYGCPTILMDR
ncbi:MAG: hypothetical protein WCT04_19370 [Planctomycetota bacterium]